VATSADHDRQRTGFLKGVINLRGTIVPIVDLRIKFNVGTAEYTPFTVVIILNIGSRVVGIVVDSVSDVTMLRQDQIRPAPEFAATVDTKYINGLCTLGERMLIVVDIERLMLSSEMALVDQAAEATSSRAGACDETDITRASCC
jgi:purine-binding chemotaxis protein CheW